ncbi:MAG: DUF4097 family beta strand repeat-containing protein [Oscillospiraceae bacterium]|nr:DUF4097 family beta strand repeat-containing protein [Oscillospiraceae bacterium]
MTRDSYIMRLHSMLGQLTPDRRREVLEDINQHFIEGTEAGMTEESLAERLGDPAELAQAYIEAFAGSNDSGADSWEPSGAAADFIGRQTYNASWSLPVPPEPSLTIDVTSVRVRVESGSADTLDVRFEGVRTNARDDYPRIEASCEDGQILIQQVHQQYARTISLDMFGLHRSSLKGTLYVLAPRKVLFKNVIIKDSSGSVDVDSLRAAQASLYSNSGSVSARGVDAGGTLNIRTSSGGSAISNSVCGALTIEANSGNLTITEVGAAIVRAKTNSGTQTISRLNAEQDIEASTTSGGAKLSEVSAGSLSVRSSSGGISLANVKCAGALYAGASSGRISGASVYSAEARFESASGSIRLDDADIGKVEAGASSGSVTLNLNKAVPTRVGTASGSVKLVFPRGSGIRYSFKTASGGLHCGSNQTGVISSRGLKEGTIGTGEIPVSVMTASGSLTIDLE